MDAATTATNLFVGLYSDNNGHPGSRLTAGNSATFQTAAWNTIPVSAVSVAAGTKYWFVLLGTGGVIKFRQKQNPTAGGWIDELNVIRTLTSLPANWTTGTIYSRGAWTSVYGSGVTSAPPVATSILSVSPAGFSWTAKVGISSLAPASVSITNTGTGSPLFRELVTSPGWPFPPAVERRRPHFRFCRRGTGSCGNLYRSCQVDRRWDHENGDRGSNDDFACTGATHGVAILAGPNGQSHQL